MDCEGLSFTEEALTTLVKLTGPDGVRSYGYTYSDVRTRLLPDAVARAYPDRAVLAEDLIEAAKGIDPSPPTTTGDGNGT